MDETSKMDGEIDLRSYVRLVLKRWRFVRDVLIVFVLAGAIFGVVAGGSALQYEATAGVAIMKSRLQVNFEDKIKTISADTAGSALAAAAQDTATRRSTLASLVKNPLVAEEVIKNMDDRLPASLRDPDALVGMVDGRVKKGTDIIEVAVTGSDPNLLPQISNAWAVSFQRYVNRMYGSSGTSVGSIESDVVAAKVRYEQAKSALLEFNVQDRSFQLERDIEYRKGVVDTLQKTRQAAVMTILTNTVGIQADFVAKYQSAALSMNGLPIVKAVDSQIAQLSSLYSTKQNIEQTLQAAHTLRDAVRNSTAGADSNRLALLLIKAQLATAGGLPAGLQLQIGTPSGAEGSAGQVADLDALMSALESRSREIQAEIELKSAELIRGGGTIIGTAGSGDGSKNPLIAEAQRMSENLLQLGDVQSLLDDGGSKKDSPLANTIDRLTSELRQLEVELSRVQYTKAELTKAYDISWQGYSTLAAKAQEIDISSQLPGSEVVFASPAVQPIRVSGVGRLTLLTQSLLLAIALGLLVGVAGVFAIEYVSPGSQNVHVPWRSLTGRAMPLNRSSGVRPRHASTVNSAEVPRPPSHQTDEAS